MITKIIAAYLNLKETEAQQLIELIRLEKLAHKKITWKDQPYDLLTCKTQADLISFLQALGQSQWFKGFDRSKFGDNISNADINKKYFDIFTKMGLSTAIKYDPANAAPEFSVVLGSSESQVTARVESLKQDLLNNIAPQENIIYGLGCDRALGIGVIETEAASKQQLNAANIAETEMNMVSLLTETALAELNAKHLTYQAINTASQIKTREAGCVKTSDTATSLKEAIETNFDITKKTHPINIAVYSCQPFVTRQQRDVQEKLGSAYHAIGVGRAVTEEDFNNHPKSVDVFLGEIARLININYKPAYLKKFDVELDTAEKKELSNLFNENMLMLVDESHTRPMHLVTNMFLPKSVSSAARMVQESKSPKPF